MVSSESPLAALGSIIKRAQDSHNDLKGYNSDRSEMIWRRITASDLAPCFEIRPEALGYELTSRTAALTVWTELLKHPAFNGIVIGARRPDGVFRIVGFAASAFVLEEFAAREIGHPRPGLNARFIARMEGNRKPALSTRGIAEANGGEGLNNLILTGCWADGLACEEKLEVQRHLHLSFAELYAGYRLRCMLSELTTREDYEFVVGRLWRIVSQFESADPVFPPRDPEFRRALVVVEPQDAMVPGSILWPFFDQPRPVLPLTERDRELLRAALNGGTDHELATELNITAAAVKRRWAALFARVGGSHPDLLSALPNAGPGEKRGPEKRSRLLAYIREHREETRPYLDRATQHSLRTSN
jgi:hypothetical protein